MKAAGGEALKGNVAAVESLYSEALAYAPDSKKVNFKLGRHYFENGEPKRGLQILRDSNWLLDVPRLQAAPVIDGRLEDKFWSQAATFGPLFAWSENHNAAVNSKVHTEMFAGYTDDAIYLAARCADAHPDSLKVLSSERDHDEPWFEDVVEFMFDTQFDRQSFVRTTINSVGAQVDGRAELSNWRRPDWSVDLKSEAAAYVGEDFWTAEYKLLFGQPEVTKPESGTLWGVDAQRGYRGGDEWSQWTRSFPDMAPLETFGWFLFE